MEWTTSARHTGHFVLPETDDVRYVATQRPQRTWPHGTRAVSRPEPRQQGHSALLLEPTCRRLAATPRGWSHAFVASAMGFERDVERHCEEVDCFERTYTSRRRREATPFFSPHGSRRARVTAAAAAR